MPAVYLYSGRYMKFSLLMYYVRNSSFFSFIPYK